MHLKQTCTQLLQQNQAGDSYAASLREHSSKANPANAVTN
jgi:hypothetical protein